MNLIGELVINQTLFNRFPQTVRDSSLNKEVDLVLSGKDTELDRSLIESLGDPLSI